MLSAFPLCFKKCLPRSPCLVLTDDLVLQECSLEISRVLRATLSSLINRCHWDPAFSPSAQTDTWMPLYFLPMCQFLSFSSGSWLSVMVPLTSLVFQFSKTTVFCLLMFNAVKFSDPLFPPCFACSIWRDDSIPVTLILTRSILFIYSCITDWKPHFTCSLEHQLQSRG